MPRSNVSRLEFRALFSARRLSVAYFAILFAITIINFVAVGALSPNANFTILDAPIIRFAIFSAWIKYFSDGDRPLETFVR